MRYLLDTCAWLDALFTPEKLSSRAADIVGNSELISLSAISLVEFTQKHANPKGELSDLIIEMEVTSFLERIALPPEKIQVLPISPAIAASAYALPGPLLRKGKPHKDPADLIITATARHHNLTLLTSDRILLDYPHLKTLNSRK